VELRQLEFFVRVAETGTYLAAAKAFAIAQPALWRQVKALEQELGTPLFERTGRNVRLTRNGELLLLEAKSALSAAGRVARAADDLRNARLGTVGIACAAPHLRAFLADAIASLRREHPGIGVAIREYGGGVPPGKGIPQDLEQGIVDFATGEMPPEDRRFESIPLFPSRLLLPVPRTHPWARRAQVDVASLRGVPIVCAQRGSFSRRAFERACARAGFIPEIAFDSHSPLSIVALGEAGLGVPILVEHSVGPPKGVRWPVLAHKGRAIAETLRISWRAGVMLSPAAEAFLTIVKRRALTKTK
jgi:DNA-binding transcriptional LysR family regulator